VLDASLESAGTPIGRIVATQGVTFESRCKDEQLGGRKGTLRYKDRAKKCRSLHFFAVSFFCCKWMVMKDRWFLRVSWVDKGKKMERVRTEDAMFLGEGYG
jgi:hypothetical protein